MVGRQYPTPDWSLEEWQQPAHAVGGDFIVTQDDGRFLRIFVGDVTGHGDSAASAADLIRPLIERELADGVSEAKLRRWSKATYELLEDRFVAMTYLQIDRETGQATIINAGNPPVVVLRRGGESVEYVRANGMPLGLVDQDEWCAPSPQRISLGAGDEIVCFTDGLPDTLGDRSQERFGVNRVVSALSNSQQRSRVQTLSASVSAFADRSAEQDDLTVLWVGDAGRRAA